MALKMGKTAKEIEEITQKQINLLGQGDVTDRYAELLLGLTPENFTVNKNENKIEKIIESEKDKVVEVNLDDLCESPRNCYSKATGKKREELLSSLKAFGQINPIFVRPKEKVVEYKNEINKPFEILVGHTRVDCLKELAKDGGVATAKAIIVDCDDVEATLLIAQSNIQREKVTEIEIARSYKNTYEALKKSKGGNDKVLKGKNENVEISTDSPKSQTGTLDRTDELVAKKYGISKNTLRRKMALAYCIDQVIKYYERKKFNQEQIQSISKISHSMQEQVCEVMKEEKIPMTNKLAKEILKAYQEEMKAPRLRASFPLNITREVMRDSLAEIKEDKISTSTSKAKKQTEKYSIPKSLFPVEINNLNAKENYIITALSYIKKNKIKL